MVNNNGVRRKRMIRLAALALVMYANVQTAYGRSSALTSASTETIHDLVEAFVKQQTESGRAEVPGYIGIHPLPRRDEILMERQNLPVLQTASAAAVAATTNAAVVTQSQAALAVQPSASASQSAVSSASASAIATASASQAPAITPATSLAQLSTKSTSKSSSSSSATASATNSSAPANGSSSMFSPQNKLFPLAIAAAVAIGLGALLVIISIGKCYSHRQMAREEREGTRKYKSKDNSVLCSADYGVNEVSRTRTLGKSLKRAFTRGKLGGNSFARRHREGTVLIDVGDEVLAVTPEVAREYERERKSVMSSYQSNNGSGGSDSRLTFPANQPTPSRQALYNAQMIVAANRAETARGGKPQAPRGFDINSWRNDSALPGVKEDDEQTLNGDSQKYEPLRRGLSRRLADGFRALTGGRGDSFEEELGHPKTSQSFSFDSEKQMPNNFRQAQVPLSATAPVLTRGSGGWAIQRNEQAIVSDDLRPAPRRSPSRKPISKQSSDSTLRDSALSHDRVVLRDEGPADGRLRAVSATVRGSTGTEAAGVRPKSILIKRSQDRLRQQQQQQQQQAVGAYRNRVAQFDVPQASGDQRRSRPSGHGNGNASQRNVASTAPGSPKTLHQRSNTMVNAAGRGAGAGAGKRGSVPAPVRKPIVLKPEAPLRVANGSSSGHSDGSSSSRDLYRPLPMPPKE